MDYVKEKVKKIDTKGYFKKKSTESNYVKMNKKLTRDLDK